MDMINSKDMEKLSMVLLTVQRQWYTTITDTEIKFHWSTASLWKATTSICQAWIGQIFLFCLLHNVDLRTRVVSQSGLQNRILCDIFIHSSIHKFLLKLLEISNGYWTASSGYRYWINSTSNMEHTCNFICYQFYSLLSLLYVLV